jgi:hypothetical protein
VAAFQFGFLLGGQRHGLGIVMDAVPKVLNQVDTVGEREMR